MEFLQYPLNAAWTEATALVSATFTVNAEGKIMGLVQMDGPKDFHGSVHTAIRSSDFAPDCAGSQTVTFAFQVRDVVAYSFEQEIVETDPNHYTISVNRRYLYWVDSHLSRPSWPKRAWRALFRR
jgi:hypothetical protein